jgi:hypothetical protein
MPHPHTVQRQRLTFRAALRRFLHRKQAGVKHFVQDFYRCSNGQHPLCLVAADNLEGRNISFAVIDEAKK